MIENCLEKVRKKKPLIHSITNYVTANDCANVLLACGARAIMADDKIEVEDITQICDGLNLNFGLLNPQRLEAMLLAAKKSNECKHPIVLDPVGIGASNFRMQAAYQLLDAVKVDVIKGNLSEMRALASHGLNHSGVDANIEDIENSDLDKIIMLAKNLSLSTDAIIVITGKIDVVTDGINTYCIYNGDEMMSKISGTGCQLSTMMCAYLSANKNDKLEACACACMAMGISGEIGIGRMSRSDGNASLKTYIIDALFNLTPERLKGMAKYEMR